MSKLRHHLHYRHLAITNHIGLPVNSCLLKCPVCVQEAIRNFHSNQRNQLANTFGINYPYINQLLPSSLNMVGNHNHQQLLTVYVSNSVEDDSLEHLLFRCSALNRYRLAYDIPTVVNNDNMKLLLGQSLISLSRWKQIISFYKRIYELRPDLF